MKRKLPPAAGRIIVPTMGIAGSLKGHPIQASHSVLVWCSSRLTYPLSVIDCRCDSGGPPFGS